MDFPVLLGRFRPDNKECGNPCRTGRRFLASTDPPSTRRTGIVQRSPQFQEGAWGSWHHIASWSRELSGVIAVVLAQGGFQQGDPLLEFGGRGFRQVAAQVQLDARHNPDAFPCLRRLWCSGRGTARSGWAGDDLDTLEEQLLGRGGSILRSYRTSDRQGRSWAGRTHSAAPQHKRNYPTGSRSRYPNPG